MSGVDFVLQWVVILLAGALGAGICRLKLRREESFAGLLGRSQHLYLVGLAIVGLPVTNLYLALRPDWQWDMPVDLQYHWAGISWGLLCGALAYVFGFCTVAAAGTGVRARWAPACFGLVVVSVIQAYAGWSSLPNLPPLAVSVYDGVILQSSPYTCVPASGANIAELLGVHATERELAKLCHTTRDGTFPAQAIRGMAKLGLYGHKVPLETPITQIHPPAMLFILHDTHAVAFAGMKNGAVEILNPSGGRCLYPVENFNELWEGHALEFSRVP